MSANAQISLMSFTQFSQNLWIEQLQSISQSGWWDPKPTMCPNSCLTAFLNIEAPQHR